jgi:hypothetical protein
MLMLGLQLQLGAHPLFDQVKNDLEQTQYFQVERILQDYSLKNPQDAYVTQFADFFSNLKQLEQLFGQRLYPQAFELYNGLFQKNYPNEFIVILRAKNKYVAMSEILQEISQYTKAGDLDYLAGLYLKAANLNTRDTQWQQDADFYKELSDLAFKAKVLFHQSSFAEAYEIFNQITQKLPEHEEMLDYRVTSYELSMAKDLYLKGFYEDAVDLFAKGVQRLPREEFLLGWKINANNALKLKKQALAFLDVQAFDDSKAQFLLILKINSQDSFALTKLKDIELLKQSIQDGTQLLVQGKYSLALMNLNKAYKIQPENKDLQQRISVCHRIMFYQSDGRAAFQTQSLGQYKRYEDLYQLVVREILSEKQRKQQQASQE